MNPYSIRSALVAAMGVALWLASGSASAETSYRLTDLSTLAGGSCIVAYGINAAGQVTGGFCAADGDEHAFLSDGATMQDLGTLPGGHHSEGRGINDAGQVTGWSHVLTGGGWLHVHAFLWDGTTMQDLGTLGGDDSYGYGINDAGQVTGVAGTSAANSHAFVWDGTTMQDLGTLGGNDSYGYGINDAGQVTGVADTSAANHHAFVWDGTTMQDLGTLGGGYSYGNGINAAGWVTGSSARNESESHAFLWNGTTMQDLGTLPGDRHSSGYGINAAGQVTGWSALYSNSEFGHAFLWDGTTMQDLNSLIDPADPLYGAVTLTEGRAINDLGQIVANGYDNTTGGLHAYIVSPPSVIGRLAALRTEVTGVGPGKSLANKVALAQTYYAVPDIPATCAVLTGFAHEVSAQRGTHIDQTTAATFIADAQAIQTAIGCN